MFAWLELRTHCHATEEEEKVVKAINFLAPGIKVARQRTEGFHRNPIIVLVARTNSKNMMKDFWRLLDGHGLVSRVLECGAKSVDEDGILHFHLGKQDAYAEKAVLTEGEDVVAVRLKIIRYPSQKDSLFDLAKHTVMELTGGHAPH